MSFISRKTPAPARLLAAAGGTLALIGGVAVMAPRASADTVPASSGSASSGDTKCHLNSDDLQYGTDGADLAFQGDGAVNCASPAGGQEKLTGTATIDGSVPQASCDGTDTGANLTITVTWSDGTKTISKFSTFSATTDGDVVGATLSGTNTDDSTRFAGDDVLVSGIASSACGNSDKGNSDKGSSDSKSADLDLLYKPAQQPQQPQSSQGLDSL